MMDIANFCPLEARRQANTEIEAYRQRVRRDKEARAAASAEGRIAAAVEDTRREIEFEIERDKVRAEHARLYAEREAAIEAQRNVDRERKLSADPRLRIAETPHRRLAKRIRARFGDDFATLLSDLSQVNAIHLVHELRRIPDDERAEALNQSRAEAAALAEAAATAVPEPMDDDERTILRLHGLAA